MFDIDWQRPWLSGFKLHGQAIAKLWQDLGSLPLALNQYAQSGLFSLDVDVRADEERQILPVDGLQGLPRFVSQAHLPAEMAYESFICDTHCVPTRENVHDFFNALCWFRYPLTKAYLNAQQARAIEQLGSAPSRGSLRDALTLLDENACFIWCNEQMWCALRRHDWLSAFWDQRAQWQGVRVELFGHALLEKLCNPYKAITAHALLVGPAPINEGLDDLKGNLDAWSDTLMLRTLGTVNLSDKPFQALPVLGVPGWSMQNTQLSFYQDEKVFRPMKLDALNEGREKRRARP